MRLKRSRLKTYLHKPAVPLKDKEGGTYTEYGKAAPFSAEIWAGGGKRQLEMYGIRLPNIRNLRIEAPYEERTEGKKVVYKLRNGTAFAVEDGICLYVGADAKPDYKIVAIYPYAFLTLEVEKL